ncbi:AAA family ATPase, partial [Arthrospira platensis SPKY1]|nr:AAA family ATPase [Arthrospira platensis SPKY1]
TEEMLAATLDALQGVERLILVGDPRQLPPIGAGRPFVDLVTQFAPPGIHGRFPRIGQDYAELTVTSRQIGGEDRDDVALSRWFSGVPLAPGEDEVLDRVLLHDGSPHIHFKAWNTP